MNAPRKRDSGQVMNRLRSGKPLSDPRLSPAKMENGNQENEFESALYLASVELRFILVRLPGLAGGRLGRFPFESRPGRFP